MESWFGSHRSSSRQVLELNTRFAGVWRENLPSWQFLVQPDATTKGIIPQQLARLGNSGTLCRHNNRHHSTTVQQTTVHAYTQATIPTSRAPLFPQQSEVEAGAGSYFTGVPAPRPLGHHFRFRLVLLNNVLEIQLSWNSM